MTWVQAARPRRSKGQTPHQINTRQLALRQHHGFDAKCSNTGMSQHTAATPCLPCMPRQLRGNSPAPNWGLWEQWYCIHTDAHPHSRHHTFGAPQNWDPASRPTNPCQVRCHTYHGPLQQLTTNTTTTQGCQRSHPPNRHTQRLSCGTLDDCRCTRPAWLGLELLSTSWLPSSTNTCIEVDSHQDTPSRWTMLTLINVANVQPSHAPLSKHHRLLPHSSGCCCCHCSDLTGLQRVPSRRPHQVLCRAPAHLNAS